MITHTVDVVYYSELCAAVERQYNLDFNPDAGKLALGVCTWEDTIRLVGFGENYIDLDLEEDLDKCMITYLRDAFPEEEEVYIHFGK